MFILSLKKRVFAIVGDIAHKEKGELKIKSGARFSAPVEKPRMYHFGPLPQVCSPRVSGSKNEDFGHTSMD
jgi:hypothetical protein